MPKWTDCTSYSRHDKDRTPNARECRVGVFRVVVHRHIHYEPDQWLLTIHPGVTENHELLSKGIRDAKGEALCVLARVLEDALQKL